MKKNISIRELRQQVKSKYRIHYFGRVLQWFAPFFVKPLLKTKITPNQVTTFMIFVGVVIAPLLFFNNYILYLIFIPLYFFYNLLDGADGALARVTKKFSTKGIFLDVFSHFIVEPVYFLVLGFGRYFATGNIYLLLLGISIAFSQMVLCALPGVFTASQYRSKTLKPATKIYNEQPAWKSLSFVQKLKFIVTKIYFIPTFSVIFMIALVLNIPDIFLIFYGLTMPIIFIVNTYIMAISIDK